MSPLQEAVAKTVLVAASIAAGGTVFTNTINNATQTGSIARLEADVLSLKHMELSIRRIEVAIATIEERTRHVDVN